MKLRLKNENIIPFRKVLNENVRQKNNFIVHFEKMH